MRCDRAVLFSDEQVGRLLQTIDELRSRLAAYEQTSTKVELAAAGRARLRSLGYLK